MWKVIDLLIIRKQYLTSITEKKLNMTSSVKKKILKQSIVDDDMIEGEIKLEELPLYDFEKVAIATNYFDLNSKLGQGGFGPVYKVGS